MLTVRFDALGLHRDSLLLDAGTGFGRHAFEAARRGATVVALDMAAAEVEATAATFAMMIDGGEIGAGRVAGCLRGDTLHLPFAASSFDAVVVSEVLEHVADDRAAVAELARVLRPGGTLAVTVPSWFPEVVNWRLSDEYHAPKAVGGHVRVYRAGALRELLAGEGITVTGSHRAHALHSPYWWLRCAVGVHDEQHRLVRAMRRLLEWEIVEQPRSMRLVEAVLAPVLGKSYVVYGTRR